MVLWHICSLPQHCLPIQYHPDQLFQVSTEQHVNPRVAAVSRRVRASSVPPSSRPYPGLQVQQQQHIQVAESLLTRLSLSPSFALFLSVFRGLLLYNISS